MTLADEVPIRLGVIISFLVVTTFFFAYESSRSRRAEKLVSEYRAQLLRAAWKTITERYKRTGVPYWEANRQAVEFCRYRPPEMIIGLAFGDLSEDYLKEGKR